jgi:capsular polysaccharide biosynthesis protein
MGKNKNKFDFDASNFLAYIFKRLKVLIVISLLAAVVSGIVSLAIHNKYKSSIVMFPTSAVSKSKSILDPNYTTSKNADLMNVGDEEDLDKLLQILNSGQIKAKLVKKFNLINHYKIDISKKGAYKKLYTKVDDNMHVNRTEYNSVIVEVLDEDPVFAANMANEIAVLVDTVFNEMNKERALKTYNAVKIEYDSISVSIKSLQDSLTILGKMGLYELGFETKEMYKAYYSALMKGRNDIANMIKKQLDIIAANAGKYNILREYIGLKLSLQHNREVRLTEAKMEVIQKLPYKFVVDYAGVADSKDSPKRMIIVLVSAISAFFVALLCFIIFENIKKLL